MGWLCLGDKQDELIDILESFLGDYVKHYESKYQITFNCPNCAANKGIESDDKGNLEINYELGLYNCWVCGDTDGTKGKLYSLIKKYADSKTFRKFIDCHFQFSDEIYTNDSFVKSISVALPKEYIELTGKQGKQIYFRALNYLHTRRITDELIEKFNIGFCSDGQYANRIIVPSLDSNNELNYFVSRTILKHQKLKYLNPSTDKTNIIFNERFINWDKAIFLVEGVFDHIVVPNSIPLLGKKIYPKLFNELYFKTQNYIIIALDFDAYGDAVKIYNKLDAGRLRNKILLNPMISPYDISLFNEKYGENELRKWLTTKNIKIDL